MRSFVHFGGPDCTPGLLRDVLAERVAAVPPGGSIDWVTYYFRDRQLATDLVEAAARGVDVRIALDGSPRTRRANDEVIAILREGLGSGLRVVRGPLDRVKAGRVLRLRVHQKLYCFSHSPSDSGSRSDLAASAASAASADRGGREGRAARVAAEPSVLLGSFNPAGDDPEQAPEIVEEIGDHHRGYNMLVELRGRALAEAVTAHARGVHRGGRFAERFRREANRPVVHGSIRVFFWPRIGDHPVARWLAGLGTGSRVRLVASHISGLVAPRDLLRIARRGVSLEVLTESSLRRAPAQTERRLVDAGVEVRRVAHSADRWIPMHDKFALVESGDGRAVAFGSFNWTDQSRFLNREVGVIAEDHSLFEAFEGRWNLLRKYAE